LAASTLLQFEPVQPSASEAELRGEVRAFLAAELGARRSLPLGQSGGRDAAFSRKLAEHGWVGMAIPEEYGGAGAGAVERFIVTEELLAAQAPVSAHWVADRQTGPTILRYGTEEQRRRFLPAISEARCFFAIGMSEPEAGSDLAAVRTRARQVDGGWSVTGTKIWTTGADESDFSVVLCRTAESEVKHAGLSQLIVDLHSDGVEIHPIRTLDGDQEFCEVVLEDVFVPDELVLGTLGNGWEQCTSELSFERYGPERWLSTWGVYKGCIATLAAGSPDSAANEQVGLMASKFRVIRQLSLAVARAIDGGRQPSLEAAAIKDLGTQFEQDVAETVRRLVDRELDPGSENVFEEMLAKSILTAPQFTIRGGSTEILRSIVAKGIRA
jgi:alkylation response protein AidB-like acyl-CoA dehydrogenase